MSGLYIPTKIRNYSVMDLYLFYLDFFAYNMAIYFGTNDVNVGMDRSRRFQWTTHEGWINLVNGSKDLSYEEKAELLGNITLL